MGRKKCLLSFVWEKKFQKLLNIHIQNPKISAKNFDYVISPNHDNFHGSNVINSVGALHHFSKLEKSSNPKLLTCIVGGNNQHYRFDTKEASELCDKLIEIKKNKIDIKLSIITSRRTSDLVKKILVEKLKDFATIWTGSEKNPYKQSIQNSSFFIVTSDSTSMISEAAISGKPIYVYHLAFKRKSRRLSNFHNEFTKLGITRDIKNINHLKNWTYNSLNESERIASIIKKRIIEENIWT